MYYVENLRLREHDIFPAPEILKKILGESFPAYLMFQDALPELELEQEWQWYGPQKVWAARGQYNWTTPRGTKKEKTLYWLYAAEGSFNVAVWFLAKNRQDLLDANVNDETKQLIRKAKTFGKVHMQTFPIALDITAAERLADVYALIKCKKQLETY